MYQEILDTFLELKRLMSEKKEAIIHKKLDELASIDENTIILSEKISKYNLKEVCSSFSDEEKKELKKIGNEIKMLQENNEILIKYSINVINNTLSGILNIAAHDKSSYDAKGQGCTDSETLDISSITEEA